MVATETENGDHQAPLILVTGGAGFIGSHTALVLLQSGYRCLAVDNFVNSVPGPDGFPESLRRVEELSGKRLLFEEADVGDEPRMMAIFAKYGPIAAVMHFAALKSVGDSVKQPLEYYTCNLGAGLTLLNCMRAHGVHRLVFSSSCTVYGDARQLPVHEAQPTGHDLPNPYGRTKHMLEQIAADLCAADKRWSVTLLRYFNATGAHPSGRLGEDPVGTPTYLTPYIAQVAVGRLDCVRIFGDDYDTPDGTGVRDYIHVMDLAAGHLAALAQLLLPAAKAQCKVYNLGTGKGTSVKQMLSAFEQAAGKKIRSQILPRRAGDAAAIYCDPSLANRELKWQATYSVSDMCAHVWRWQSSNPNGYRLPKLQPPKTTITQEEN